MDDGAHAGPGGPAARPRVAVIGGGFSGSLLSLHLLSDPDGPCIYLIERAGEFGPGLAYASHHADHLLNVRAGNMSAFPERPAHFLDWLRKEGLQADPAGFVSRAQYGRYLLELLRRAATGRAAAGRLVLVTDEVVALERRADGVDLRMAMGHTLAFEAAVLATGALPPRLPEVAGAEHLVPPRYVDNPWRHGALAALEPDQPVLVQGSGLTMVDVASRLIASGHRAPVLALSRRGLAPHRHDGAPVAVEPPPMGPPLSHALRRFRRQIGDGDWRTALDAVRGQTTPLWMGLTDAERGRFLRHLRPYWDIHRHRLAPLLHARLEAWRAAGQVQVLAGRIISVAPLGDGLEIAYRPRGSSDARSLAVGAVINATGLDGDLGHARDPLLKGLLEAGLVRPDILRLGLDADAGGRVLDRDGRADFRLTAIGPLTRGAVWEAVAVPDLRNHAVALAGHLSAALAAHSRELAS